MLPKGVKKPRSISKEVRIRLAVFGCIAVTVIGLWGLGLWLILFKI